MGEELAVLDHQLDARAVHVHDASSADVKVAHLTVAHLTVGEADKRAAGLDERVGIVAQKAVVCGLAGERDRIGFGLGAIAPAVEDDEDERFGTHFASSSWRLAYKNNTASDLHG